MNPFRDTLKVGDIVTQKALAKTLTHLSQFGLDAFYQGELAQQMAKELEEAGSPLRLADFIQHKASIVTPLTHNMSQGQFYNLGAPTQGLASLLILGIYDRLAHQARSQADHVHLLIEATKLRLIFVIERLLMKNTFRPRCKITSLPNESINLQRR